MIALQIGDYFKLTDIYDGVWLGIKSDDEMYASAHCCLDITELINVHFYGEKGLIAEDELILSVEKANDEEIALINAFLGYRKLKYDKTTNTLIEL